MSALNNSALIGASGSTGYQISRSVRLRSSASAYFNRTFGTPTNQQIWTFSAWCKLGLLSNENILFGGTTTNAQFYFASGGALRFEDNNAAVAYTTAVYRDPSAWYHVLLAINTGASGTNKVRLYVNGVEITAFSTDNRSTYTTSYFNRALAHTIGKASSQSLYLDGYLTEINFIDGQALTPLSFGAYNAYGVWSPMKYNGTYGNNGFYLNFSDNSGATATTIGADRSGNGNNWTPNNISVTAGATYDSMLDVPTPWGDGGNGRGNYCTLNPVDVQDTAPTNGNLSYTRAAGVNGLCSGTFVLTSGKWYWEVTITTVRVAALVTGVGVSGRTAKASGTNELGFYSDQYSYLNGGNKYNNATSTAYGASYTTGDIIGIAYDADAGTLVFYKNGVSQGTAFSSIPAGNIRPMAYSNGDAQSYNFGQRPFSYTPPSGFRALNTQNLPVPTIANGANYFAATLYTGTGASRSVDNTVNNVSFQPDFVWAKGRSGATDHALYDAVRGVQKQWETNTTTAETTETTGLTAFNSNGFTVGALAQMNTNTATYVAWQWKEGATQGFDIVTYTGDSTASRSVNHNLGVTPSMIFVKNRTTAQNNPVAHTSLAVGNLLLFDTTGASGAAGTRLRLGNSTAFTVGDAADYTITNQTGNDYVAYCFAAIAGFSAFGSYTGNGSADGPFVFCGFRPAFVLIKNTNTAGNEWFIYDDVRNTFNVMDKYLLPNSSAAEGTFTSLDFVSNGFKLRTGAAAALNANAGNYIYAAFAENPFKYSLAR